MCLCTVLGCGIPVSYLHRPHECFMHYVAMIITNYTLINPLHLQDIKRGMNAHDRKGDSEGTYFNFFSVVYSQSNQIVHFILRKGENIWVMLIWSSLRMKSNGIISPSAHWHQGLFGYVGMWMSLYLVHMLKCLSGTHLALPAEYVSFSKGFDRELGNYSLFWM